MMKRFWYKAAALVMTGVVLNLGLGGGCMSAVVQRILVAATFD